MNENTASVMVKKKNNLQSQKKKRLLFYILMFSVPTLQFLIFYVYVNFNSILMAFQRYNVNQNGLGYRMKFVGFDNFETAWKMFANSGDMILNSLKLYAWNLFLVMPLALLFSYYIAKKHPCAGLFRVLLFLPSMISGMVMAILYKYIVTDVYIHLVKELTGIRPMAGLLDIDRNTQYITVLIFNIWLAFGSHVLLYTGAMSAIDQSLIESAQLDGVNVIQEFWYIYLPLIYPTFTTFVVTGITGIFSNQMALFSFFGTKGAMFDVFGYYLFRMTKMSSVQPNAKMLSYPELSALGLIITGILVPLTLTVRKLMRKFGPSTD